MFKADILDFLHLEELVEKHSLQQEIGTVLKQVGEVFMDEEIMCYANKFDSNVPIIIDYENKKNYEWNGTIYQRLCSLDSKRFLREVKHD